MNTKNLTNSEEQPPVRYYRETSSSKNQKKLVLQENMENEPSSIIKSMGSRSMISSQSPKKDIIQVKRKSNLVKTFSLGTITENDNDNVNPCKITIFNINSYGLGL